MHNEVQTYTGYMEFDRSFQEDRSHNAATGKYKVERTKEQGHMGYLELRAGLEIAGSGAQEWRHDWLVLHLSTSAALESLQAADGCSSGAAAVLEGL